MRSRNATTTTQPCRHGNADRVQLMILPEQGAEQDVLEVCMSCPRERRYHKVAQPAHRHEVLSDGSQWARHLRCPA